MRETAISKSVASVYGFQRWDHGGPERVSDMPKVTPQVSIVAEASQGLSLVVEGSLGVVTWQCFICYKKKQASQLEGSILACLLEAHNPEMDLELQGLDVVRTSW